jgi:membrane fusion protein (multidrug efflux system)
MATSFSRTLRSLRADRPTSLVVAIVVGGVLLAAWSWWMIAAPVAVYEATTAARLEVERAAHPVQAPASGRVVTANMPLGRDVEIDDVLYELDVDAQRLELLQAKARLSAIGPEIAAAKKELEAQAQAAADDGQGIHANSAEARARHDEARAAVKLAEEHLARTTRLRAEGLASEADLSRARADSEQRRAAAEALQAAIGRIGASGRADLSDRRARRESLAREIATLEGEELTTKALIERLEHEVGRRVVRASVAGRVAEVASITVGSVVREGDRLGAIVPRGGLRIVAEYSPSRALGRIQLGQPARLRLEGFPWAQHGTLPATVTRVASEVRDGRVRVELDVLPHHLTVPLQHGQPGTLEVEVERASPAVLVLRAAGKVLEGPQAPPPPDVSSRPPSGAPP